MRTVEASGFFRQSLALTPRRRRRRLAFHAKIYLNIMFYIILAPFLSFVLLACDHDIAERFPGTLGLLF
jgi:hypothetical protein